MILFDEYLSKYDFTEEFHNNNINMIKGDIFEHLAKYHYTKLGYITYLFNEVPDDIYVKMQKNIYVKKGLDAYLEK